MDQAMLICRVQARIRGFLMRRKYRVMQLNSQNMSKYFKAEEAKETLT